MAIAYTSCYHFGFLTPNKMNFIYFQEKEKDFEQIKIELQKAKLDIEPCYSFQFLNWTFNRSRKHWKVETTTEFGFTKEKGNELHNTSFPVEMFDEEKNSKYGHYIRLEGHSGCPSPDYENGLWLKNKKCVSYHIDNQCAFNFFVNFLRQSCSQAE